MRILVIGMGHVGKATARGFSKLGHDVLCRDIHGDRPSSDVCFICTPETEVDNAIRGVEAKCITIRSTTVPNALREHVCHNPCFGREKTIYADFNNPEMIVIGECCKSHGDILEGLYAGFDAPILRVDVTTSQIAKLALNSYLATQISFWNEIKLLCDCLNIRLDEVTDICKSDSRVSGYGTLPLGPFEGSCLPKDLSHTIELFRSYGIGTKLLSATESVNKELENELYTYSRV